MIIAKPPFAKQIIPDMEYIKTATWRLDSGDSFYNGYWVDDTITTVAHLMPVSDDRFAVVTAYNVDRTYYYTVYNVKLYETSGDFGAVTLLDSQNIQFPGLVNCPQGFKYTRTFADFKNVGDKLVAIAYVTTEWDRYRALAVHRVKHVFDFAGDTVNLVSTTDPYDIPVSEDTPPILGHYLLQDSNLAVSGYETKMDAYGESGKVSGFSAEFSNNRYMQAFCRYSGLDTTPSFETVLRFFQYDTSGNVVSSSEMIVPSENTYSPNEFSEDPAFIIEVTQLGPQHAFVGIRRSERRASDDALLFRHDLYMVKWVSSPEVSLFESFVLRDDLIDISFVTLGSQFTAMDDSWVSEGAKTKLRLAEPDGRIPLLFYPAHTTGGGISLYNPNAERVYSSAGMGTRIFAEMAGDSLSVIKHKYREFEGWNDGSEHNIIGGQIDFIAHIGNVSYTGTLETYIPQFAGGESRLGMSEFDRIDFNALTLFGAERVESNYTPWILRYYNTSTQLEAVNSKGIHVGNRIVHVGSNKNRLNYTNESWRSYLFSLYFLPPE